MDAEPSTPVQEEKLPEPLPAWETFGDWVRGLGGMLLHAVCHLLLMLLELLMG